MIKTSLDWPPIETALLHKASELSFSADVCKMIKNIQISITELSKAEVQARRDKKDAANALLKKVNDEIEMVEEYLLIATLIG
jgi:hypothetical protein